MRRLLSIATAGVLAATLTVSGGVPTAHAYELLGCKFKTKNIGFRVLSPLKSYPTWGTGVNRWGTALKGKFTLNPSGTIHLSGTNENRGNTVNWAGIYRKKGTTSTAPVCSGGYWTAGSNEVVLNWSVVEGYSASKRAGIATHELGHAFGLAHKSTSTVVMYTNIAISGTVFSPAQDDKDGVNALYK